MVRNIGYQKIKNSIRVGEEKSSYLSKTWKIGQKWGQMTSNRSKNEGPKQKKQAKYFPLQNGEGRKRMLSGLLISLKIKKKKLVSPVLKQLSVSTM